MVQSVDDATGQVMKVLDELGIADRTLVLFTSDNGGLDNRGRPTENAPLRSGKGYAYEGGIRVPFIVRWPDTIPPGTVSAEPVCSIDIFPTLLEASGIPLPNDRSIDGLSLIEHLRSGARTPLGRDDLVWHFPHYRHAPGPYSILLHGDWKLIKYWEDIFELYHLATDVGEANNLAASMPEKVHALDALLQAHLVRMNAKLPHDNPAFQQEGK